MGGPELHKARIDDVMVEDKLARALRLAREIEDVLEEERASQPSDDTRPSGARMARAIAASLVDELDGLTRTRPRSGAA